MAVVTAVNVNVAVSVEVCARRPPDDSAAFDHVVEAGLLYETDLGGTGLSVGLTGPITDHGLGAAEPPDPEEKKNPRRDWFTVLLPLEDEASGLQVLSQDGRVWRRLTEDAATLEQEFVVEVDGEIAPYGLHRLAHGLSYRGRPLPPAKVSWQNEVRLRFAIKAVQPGQLRAMCAEVGLTVVSIRRLRIGRIPLAKMAPGEWRYLPVGERF